MTDITTDRLICQTCSSACKNEFRKHVNLEFDDFFVRHRFATGTNISDCRESQLQSPAFVPVVGSSTHVKILQIGEESFNTYKTNRKQRNSWHRTHRRNAIKTNSRVIAQ